MLRGDFKEGMWELIRRGQKVFPEYEAILSDNRAKVEEVVGIFVVLRSVQGDRSRFVEHAVRSLAHQDVLVRWTAVQLLEQIGKEGDASPVVALLSDRQSKGKVIAYSAAQTLTAIGGRREVVAMDAWLRGGAHADDAQLRAHVKKHRDLLKKRLDELDKKKT